MTDRDIDRWTSAWREGAKPAGDDLARLARREQRLLRAWIALDWLAGAAFIAFAAWLWIADGSPVMRFAAAGIVALTAAALAFSVHNWRGAFLGERESAADFLALAGARARARLRYVRFGWWLLAADLVVIAGAAILEYRHDGAGRLPAMAGAAAVATAGAAAILGWWGRRERRRAARLATLVRALRAGTAARHD